jgi:hypothetical protein
LDVAFAPEKRRSKLACILLYLEVWPFPTERRGLKGRKSLKKTKKDERKDLQ